MNNVLKHLLSRNTMINAHSFTVIHGEPPSRAATIVPNPAFPPSSHPWVFVALIEIDSQERKTDAIIQRMMSELQARSEASRGETGEEVLMEVCRKFNENANLLTRKNQAWYQRMRVALAIIDGTVVSLALFGSARAYLLHKGRIIDIQKSVQPESGRSIKKPLKIFSSLLEGRMAVGDKLLLSCPHLFDYFSLERLQAVLADKSASEAAPHLARMLKGLPGSVCVSAVIAESAPEKAMERAPVAAGSSHQSVVELNALASRTAQFLTPGIGHRFERLAHQLRPSPAPAEKPEPAPRAHIVEAPRIGFASVWREKIKNAVTRAVSAAGNFISVRVRAFGKALVPKKEPLLPSANTVIATAAPLKPVPAWRALVRNVMARFRRLPRSSQYLFIGAVLLALLFLESIISIAHQRITAQEREAFAAGTARLEQMMNEAEASLIYGDEETARQKLQEAAGALDRLVARGSEHTDKRQSLAARLTGLRAQAFHTRVIDQPEALLNLAQFLEGEAVLSPGGLIGPSGEFMLSYTTQGSTFFIIEPQAKSVTVASADANTDLTLLRGTTGDNGLFYLVTSVGLARFNARERLYRPLTAIAGPEDIADLAVFGTRLYSLNRSTGAILRYGFTESGLSEPTPWFAAGTTVPGATAMAIDGSIYLADAAGEIRKYTRGAREDFSVGALEPQLSTPSRLAVDNNYLYILDPTEKRIIILNKDGTLKEQITSPAFDRLIGLVPHASRKVIYVLNGTILYSVPFPQ